METGHLSIGTYPTGAQIYINNVLILDKEGQPALSPVVLLLPAGYYNVTLTLQGYCNEFADQWIMNNETVNIYRNFDICR
jgi:hypothetical protein